MKSAALALALFLALPSAAMAQTGGVPVAAVGEWLGAQGLTPGETDAASERPSIQMQSDDLTWTLFFVGCEQQRCREVQFDAVFVNPDITLDMANAWNRDNRYLKAHFEPAEGDEPAALVAEYDVIMLPGLGVEQLTEHLAAWRQLLAAFAVHAGYFEMPPEAPAA